MSTMEAPKLQAVFLPNMNLLFATLAIIAALTLYSMTLSAEHFNGIDPEEDKDLLKYVLNRVYFATTTASVVGYGDITPKSSRARLMAIMVQMYMLFNIRQELTMYFQQQSDYNRNK